VIKRGLPQHPVYMVIEFTILCAILRSGTLSCIAICMDRTNSAQMPNRPSADPDSRSLKFVCINKKKSGNKMLRDKVKETYPNLFDRKFQCMLVDII
jgi:hypothetical protein